MNLHGFVYFQEIRIFRKKLLWYVDIVFVQVELGVTMEEVRKLVLTLNTVSVLSKDATQGWGSCWAGTSTPETSV